MAIIRYCNFSKQSHALSLLLGSALSCCDLNLQHHFQGECVTGPSSSTLREKSVLRVPSMPWECQSILPPPFPLHSLFSKTQSTLYRLFYFKQNWFIHMHPLLNLIYWFSHIHIQVLVWMCASGLDRVTCSNMENRQHWLRSPQHLPVLCDFVAVLFLAFTFPTHHELAVNVDSELGSIADWLSFFLFAANRLSFVVGCPLFFQCDCFENYELMFWWRPAALGAKIMCHSCIFCSFFWCFQMHVRASLSVSLPFSTSLPWDPQTDKTRLQLS